MGEIILDKQSEPDTPSSGDVILYIDDSTSDAKLKHDDGSVSQLGGDSFSYEHILSSETVTIPIRKQMITAGTLILEGTLNVLGTLAIV